MQGRLPAGEHAEYMSACGVEDGIPIDLFEADRPVEAHADAVTPAPAAGSGAGLNIGSILPYIFDQSIARRLGIRMPVVQSGTWSELVVTAPPGTAAAKAKGDAIDSTAGALTPVSSNPRRISARLSLTAEDIAQIGTPRFEAAMRQSLTGSLEDGYDSQCLNGDGQSPNVNGIMNQLTDPTAPTTVATFDSMLTTAASFTGSKYGETLRDLSIIVPSDTYRLSVRTFRDKEIDDTGKAAVSLGSVSAQRYLSDVLGGWSSATRLPNAPVAGQTNANISTGIARRTGRGMTGAAVHAVWNHITIDDICTDSNSATRHLTLHVLVGDKVMLVRPKGEIYDKVA